MNKIWTKDKVFNESYKYSTLDPEAVILIDGDTSIVLKKDGEVVLDDSEKEITMVELWMTFWKKQVL